MAVSNLEKYLADWGQETIDGIEDRYNVLKPGNASKNFMNKFGRLNNKYLTTTSSGLYRLVIKAPPEWKFINYGVNGLLQPQGSKYSFRKKGISNEGQRRFRQWMRSRQIIPDARNPYLQKLYNKNKEEALDKLARFILIPSVKKKGIKPTPFVSEVITPSYISKFRKEAVRQFGKDISIIISKKV